MEWKIIEEAPCYSVSEKGDVKRNSYTKVDTLGRIYQMKEKQLKQRLDQYGYPRVTLIAGLEKPKFITVHRLVAKAFIPNPDSLPCVNHKDENKQNNNVENLEWCSVSYNNNYGTRLQRVSQSEGKSIIGEKDGEKLYFNSASEAGKFLNKASSNISECANGKFKQMYGYKWRWV